MPVGKVTSFSPNKGYGFIASNDETFFFHQSDLPANCPVSEVKKGALFEFDDVPQPKGMAAKKLKYIEQVQALFFIPKFVVRRENTPKYGQVLSRIPIKSPFYRDPQDCRDDIIEGAKKIGFNGVLNLTVHRTTRVRGNYFYTMHWASGDLCLLAEQKYCQAHEKNEQDEWIPEYTEEAEERAKELVKRYRLKRLRQRTPWVLLIVIAFFIIGQFPG